MRLYLSDYKSPDGIGYELWRGGQKVANKCLEFGKDISWTREAGNEIPFAGDAIQRIIEENGITNSFNIPYRFEDILADVHPLERKLPEFTKGKSVWFPVENGISTKDPYCYHADPAMGYVKSVDDKGVVEIDVRKVYKRVEPPNIVLETRKMESLDGTAYVDGKYCFENRKECMEYIIAESHCGKIFLAEVEAESIELTDEDLAGLEETSDLKM